MEPVGKIGQRDQDGMTVADLLAFLSSAPGDAKVWIDCDGEYFYKPDRIYSRPDAYGNNRVIFE